MKKTMLFSLIGFIGFSLVSCQQPVSQNSITPSLSSEEIAQLKSLQPAAEAIINARLQTNSSKGFSTEESIPIADSAVADLLLDDIKALLKDNMGQDYEKYIIITTVASSPQPAASRGGLVLETVYNGTLYSLGWWCKWATTPFGAWGWAGAGIQYIDGDFIGKNASSVATTTYGDEVTTVRTVGIDSNYVKSERTGSFKKGFFPKIHNVRASFTVGDNLIALGQAQTFNQSYGTISGNTWSSYLFGD